MVCSQVVSLVAKAKEKEVVKTHKKSNKLKVK
jgi:hypothetical protein